MKTYRYKIRINNLQISHVELISTLNEEDMASILAYNCEIVGRKEIKGKVPEE